MRKLKKYSWYTIRFYDHFISNEDKQVICKVRGMFLDDDDKYYHFSWWEVESDDVDIVLHNCEKFSVLKDVVISIRKCKN
jgi:hypothetical protein